MPTKATQSDPTPGPWRGDPGECFPILSRKTEAQRTGAGQANRLDQWKPQRVGNIWLLSRSYPRSLFHAAVISLTPQLLSVPTGGCLWLFSWHHLPSIYVKHPHLLARSGWLLP